MGVPSAARQAFKLSVLAFVISGVLLELLPHPFKYAFATTRFFVEQLTTFAATFAIFFSWELTHHLHWVGFSQTNDPYLFVDMPRRK